MGHYLKLLQEAAKKAADGASAPMRKNAKEVPTHQPVREQDTTSFASSAHSHIPPSHLSNGEGNAHSLYNKKKLFNDINDITSQNTLPSPSHRQEIDPPLRKCERSERSPFAGAFKALAARRPKRVLNQRYIQAMDDARVFLDTFEHQAEALGWSAEDLFGLDPVAPMARYDAMGLIWSLQGCPVVALTSDAATIQMPTGNHLRFYRRAARVNRKVTS